MPYKNGAGNSTRTSGKTRESLITAAVPLFLDRGYAGVSVAEIAHAADAYPNQVTHHFGGKEALFVHAASHAVLRTARRAEQRSRGSATPDDHARGLLTYLLGPGAPALSMYAEAMLAARRVPALQEVIVATHEALSTAGERAMAETFTRTGWTVRASPGEITRGFWAAVLGLALEKTALGASFRDEDAEAVVLMLVRLNASAAGTPAGQTSPDNPTEPTDPADPADPTDPLPDPTDSPTTQEHP